MEEGRVDGRKDEERKRVLRRICVKSLLQSAFQYISGSYNHE